MGQRIETRGCPSCGNTQYKTVETDQDGNPTGESLWICNAPGCGRMG